MSRLELVALPYSWIVVTTDGQEHDLSTPEPLVRGDVVFREVVERVEACEGYSGRVTCRKPTALMELLLGEPTRGFEPRNGRRPP